MAGPFQFSNITQHTFFLFTGILNFVGWVISFGAQCAGQRTDSLYWWYQIFVLLVFLGLYYVIAIGGLHLYRQVFLTFLAVDIVFLTDATSSFLNFPPAWSQAAAAGFIFQTIVQILWVIAIGSSDESTVGNQINSVRASAVIHGENIFKEASLPLNPGRLFRRSQQPPAPATTNISAPYPVQTVALDADPNGPEYKDTATALHAYTANPEDPNELSFAKGEVLEIVDKKGNWWQARKTDGTVGIVPSNYFAQ